MQDQVTPNYRADHGGGSGTEVGEKQALSYNRSPLLVWRIPQGA